MEQDNVFIKTFPVVWVVTIVVGIALYFLLGAIEAVSFALGSITSLMMMSMLYKSANKVVKETSKEEARKIAIKNYAFRYFFYALILVVSALHENLNVFFVAGGFLVFKFCLYCMLYYSKRGEKA